MNRAALTAAAERRQRARLRAADHVLPSSGPRCTRPVPTPALLHVLVAGGLLHELGRLTGSAWLALAAGALLALPVVAVVARPRLDGLLVTVSGPDRGVAGRPSAVVYEVRNTGRRATTAARLDAHSPGHERVHVALPALRPGEAVVVPLLLEVERASAAARPVVLVALSPLGLLRLVRVQPLAGWVVVHPAQRPALPLPAVAGRAGMPRSCRPEPGRGTEVLGLRERRPGDPAGALAARASARHGRPVVLERERERLDVPGPLVVLVQRAHGPAWEDGLAVAASTAVQALRAGVRPVLLGLPPLPAGRLRPRDVLDAFAAADDSPRLPGSTLTAALEEAGHGTTLLVVAAAGDPAARLAASSTLARLGGRLVALVA